MMCQIFAAIIVKYDKCVEFGVIDCNVSNRCWNQNQFTYSQGYGTNGRLCRPITRLVNFSCHIEDVIKMEFTYLIFWRLFANAKGICVFRQADIASNRTLRGPRVKGMFKTSSGMVNPRSTTSEQ